MKTFLLAENQDVFHGDCLVVFAKSEEKARELAAEYDSCRMAGDGNNLWQNQNILCYEIGSISPLQQEGILMEGTILMAFKYEEGRFYSLAPFAAVS